MTNTGGATVLGPIPMPVADLPPHRCAACGEYGQVVWTGTAGPICRDQGPCQERRRALWHEFIPTLAVLADEAQREGLDATWLS